MTAVSGRDAVVTAPDDDGGMDLSEGSAVLVVRVWTEDGTEVRARVTTTVGSTAPSTVVAGSLDQIRALVAGFFRDLGHEPDSVTVQ